MSECRKGNENRMNMVHTKGTVKQYCVGSGPRCNEILYWSWSLSQRCGSLVACTNDFK